MVRNILYIISLGLLLPACSSQKAVVSTPKPISMNETVPKPEIKHDVHGDYFKVNIADATKNDNTISYGSIVSAKPENYKVVRTFFPAMAQNFRQKYLILHYTALDNDKSVMVLTKQSVSSHYLVNDKDDKEIYQLVDENKRSYHAGISSWRSDKMLNDTSIGIEIVNAGFTSDASGKKTFSTFPDAQVKKVAELAKDIIDRYSIPPTNVLGHSDIAPTRKQDPGPQFPWKKLYDEYKIGMWYDDAVKQIFYNQILASDFTNQINTPSFIIKIQTVLQQFGYGIEPSGSWDDATKKTVEAFQYHFRPQQCDGVVDAETWAILQALIQKYPSK